MSCTQWLCLTQGVEHEQHHLQMRATRHLKTVKSTHRRTLVYYLAIYAAIVLSSALQVLFLCIVRVRTWIASNSRWSTLVYHVCCAVMLLSAPQIWCSLQQI